MKKTWLNPFSVKRRQEILEEAQLKKEFMIEFGNTCMLCFGGPDWQQDFIVDLMHLIPKSLGGKTFRLNCRLGCRTCHDIWDNENLYCAFSDIEEE